MKKILCLCLCFLMVISLAVPVFAEAPPDELPSPYSVITSDFQTRFPYHFVQGTVKDDHIKYRLVAGSTPFYVSNNMIYQSTEKGDESLFYLSWHYDPTTDDGWTNYSGYSTTFGTNISSATGSRYYASSHDLYSEDGTLVIQADSDFFTQPPTPLWEEVEQVTRGEIPQMAAETAKTASTLVACGIGCLALLTGLVLLAKKFRRFLP